MLDLDQSSSARRSRRKTFPPGPRGNLVWGSLGRIRQDMIGFLRDLSSQYGDVAGFRVGHLACCLIGHPELVQQVFVRDADQFVKSWDYRRLRSILGCGLICSEAAQWKRQRETVAPAFSVDRVRSYQAAMCEEAEYLAASWPDQGVLDLHHEMMRLTLRIIARILFGADIHEQSQEIGEALGILTEYMEDKIHGRALLPLWLPTPRHRQVHHHLRQLGRIVDLLIGRSNAGEDLLLEKLLVARDHRGRRLTKQQLRDQMLTLLVAGHETTAIGLATCLHQAAQHPDVQQRLVDEAGGNAVARASDLEVKRLPWTTATIRETLRLYPPVWGVGRQTGRDYELAGYVLPKGTQVFACQYLIQRDERFFSNPSRFAPCRWHDDNALHTRAYFPFGLGPRSCVGMYFAMTEMAIVLQTLTRQFQFTPADRNQHLEFDPGITLRPSSGVHLHVTRRQEGPDVNYGPQKK